MTDQIGPNEIIAPADTDPTVSEWFDVPDNKSVNVMCDPSLGAAETASIEFSPDKSETNFLKYSREGVAVELALDNNVVNLIGPTRYRVSKIATSAPVAVRLQKW